MRYRTNEHKWIHVFRGRTHELRSNANLANPIRKQSPETSLPKEGTARKVADSRYKFSSAD